MTPNKRQPNLEKPSTAIHFQLNLGQALLEEHHLWVASGGKEGARANLQGLNLCQENLSEANLEQALLGRSDLEGANLYKISLRKSDLSQANFHNADLRDADLTESTNLQVEQLSGANLSNAKLPKEINIYNNLKNIEDASKNAKNVFFLMILLCLYSWLTMGTTYLDDLITNYSTSRLPIVYVPIHIVSFFIWAPAIILFIYFYFQISMQRLWELLSTMPAVFPDGEPIDRRIYPWFLTGLARSYFKNLKTNKKLPFWRLQKLLSVASAWFIVPLTLYLFWGNYLYRHEIIGTVWLLLIFSISVAFSVTSRNFALSTLKRKSIIFKSTAWGYLIFIFCFTALFPLSIGFIYGFSPFSTEYASELSANDIRILVPHILYKMTGVNITGVSLNESDLSIKPSNWTGKDIQELDLVKGAHLNSINLRNAQAERCFLVKADLRYSDLQTANLWEADLRKADLKGAILRGALLYKVDLQDANMKFANLQGAYLSYANLRDSNLYASSLKNANLDHANLQGANIELANLQGANLRATQGLKKDQLKKASSFILAYYDEKLIDELGLPKDHNKLILFKNLKGANLQKGIFAGADLSGFDLENANLRGAILSAFIPHEPLFKMTTLQGANLKNSDLREAKLYGANLKNVKLEGARLNKANLEDADLTGATGVTKEQIDSAVINEKTKLP